MFDFKKVLIVLMFFIYRYLWTGLKFWNGGKFTCCALAEYLCLFWFVGICRKTQNIANIRTLQKIVNEINDLRASLMFCIVLTTPFSRTIGYLVLLFSMFAWEFPEHCAAITLKWPFPPATGWRVVTMSLQNLFWKPCMVSACCKLGLRYSRCPRVCLG